LEFQMRKIIARAAAGMLLLPGATDVRASGGEEGAEGLHLVPMEMIRVPVIEGNRADGTLQVKLVLVARDAAAALEAGEDLPRLRATSVATALEFARLYASPMLPVDVERLSADMTAAIHQQDQRIQKVLVVEVMASRA
jgi:hypothetical protein